MYKREIIKALSIKQPWASFIATGKKTIETRTWFTTYRGPLLIVSSKQIDKNYPGHNFLSLGLRFGQALAIVDLIDCRFMREKDAGAAMAPYHADLYSWEFANVRQIKPFSVKGRRGLYEVQIREGT